MKRKTDGEFTKEVHALVGSEYTFNEPYVTSRIKISVTHNKCGNTYMVNPNLFLKGGRCPECSGNLALLKTTEVFKKEVYDLVKDEYTILGEYVNRATNIKLRHNVCGREYEVQPGNFLQGSRFIECYYQSLRLSQEEACNKLLEAIGDKYEMLDDYSGNVS